VPDVPDPYRVLGLRRAASLAEIKSAHRRLAKTYHPDAGGDGARFLAIQAAYQLLADPVQRRRWDATHAPGPVEPGDGHVAPRRGGASRRADGARERRTGTRRRPAGASGEQERRTDRPGAGTTEGGRDPSSMSWTWSAAGVPWWEEERKGRGPGPGGGGGPSTGTTGTTSTGGRDSGGPAKRPAPDGRPGAGDRRRPGESGASASSHQPADTAVPPRSDGARGPSGAGAPDQGDPGMDVYNRSSGAAWSAASRAYFRKVAADMPRGARMGHSSWTGRVGWEPSAEEIARSAAQRTARRRARPTRRPVPPGSAQPAATSAPTRPATASGDAPHGAQASDPATSAAPLHDHRTAQGARAAETAAKERARPGATTVPSIRRLLELVRHALRG
jgi:DnaJ domain